MEDRNLKEEALKVLQHPKEVVSIFMFVSDGTGSAGLVASNNGEDLLSMLGTAFEKNPNVMNLIETIIKAVKLKGKTE